MRILREIGLLLMILALMFGCRPAANQPAPLPAARATVHADQPIRTIPQEIFGVNLEWLYDGSGIWDANSKSHFEDRLRKVAEIDFGSLRYPGGTLSDYFHWQEAIGEDRKQQYNPFYIHDGEQRKHAYPAYGPAEFLQTCEVLGATPWITANVGTGTAEEAAAWAEWCREQGGEVTHWEIGNEVYMKPDAPENVSLTAEEYVERFNGFARALKGVNPANFVCAIGQMPSYGILAGSLPQDEWNQVVIDGCAAQMDALALHHAYAPVVTLGPDGKHQPEEDVFRAMLGAGVAVRESTANILSLIRERAPERADAICLAVTEHEGLFYPMPGQDPAEAVRPNRTLGSAVYLATLYNLFISEPAIRFAHKMTLITPVFGGVLNTRWEPGQEVWPNPQYFVCREYARCTGQVALGCDVEAESYSAPAVGFVPPLARVPYLDAAAALADSGELTVFLVNRSLDQPLPAAVGLPGYAAAAAQATVIGGPRFDAANDGPDNLPVQPLERTLEVADPLVLELPPCSLTVVRLSRTTGDPR